MGKIIMGSTCFGTSCHFHEVKRAIQKEASKDSLLTFFSASMEIQIRNRYILLHNFIYSYKY